MSKKKIAGFVMTYERPEILPDTIKRLFDQSLPPEKILIVDNSTSFKTQEAAANLDPRVSYFRVGYNSGPAGAAKLGLEILAKEGYKWIYWGDDDDPPPTNDCFEKLVNLAEALNGKCGQVGMVGAKFNKLTGLIQRTSNEELFKKEYVEVDTIAGGSCKIINAKVILDGILPDEKLFFCFEDLDFDLALKRAGYESFVHSDLFLQCRKQRNRMNYKHVIGRKKHENKLWREYYSIRNSLSVTLKNKFYSAFIFILGITLLKCAISFKHGFKYGSSITKITFKALKDFGMNRYYQQVMSQKK